MLVMGSRKTNRLAVTPQAQIMRLIVGNKQKCLICKTVIIQAGKSRKLQLRSKKYIHSANCPQKDKF